MVEKFPITRYKYCGDNNKKTRVLLHPVDFVEERCIADENMDNEIS